MIKFFFTNFLISLFFFISTCVQAKDISLDRIEVYKTENGTFTREVVVWLKDANKDPLKFGELIMTADMPSMPMAHRLPKVKARPGNEDGTYYAILPFEMKGEWAIKIEILKPSPGMLVKKIHIK